MLARALPRLARHQRALSSLALLARGEGFLGALGTGSPQAHERPVHVAALDAERVCCIAAGWFVTGGSAKPMCSPAVAHGRAHSAFGTEDGRLLLCGKLFDMRTASFLRNLHHSFPRVYSALSTVTGNRLTDHMEPTEYALPEGHRVARLDSSGAFTAVVADTGHLFTVGDNAHGQCGDQPRLGETHKPAPYEVTSKLWRRTSVRDVSTGFQHAVALTEDGRAFSWGKAMRGQLGWKPDLPFTGTPHEVYVHDIDDALDAAPAAGASRASEPVDELGAPADVVRVSAGFNHGAALRADGRCYVWGKHLGLATTRRGVPTDQFAPRRLELPAPAVDLICGMHHTLIFTADGGMWAVGFRDVGAAADGADSAGGAGAGASRLNPHPQRLLAPEQVATACGLDPARFAARLEPATGLSAVGLTLQRGLRHSFMLTEDGRVLRASWTELLRPDESLAHLRVRAISESWRHALILAER